MGSATTKKLESFFRCARLQAEQNTGRDRLGIRSRSKREGTLGSREVRSSFLGHPGAKFVVENSRFRPRAKRGQKRKEPRLVETPGMKNQQETGPLRRASPPDPQNFIAGVSRGLAKNPGGTKDKTGPFNRSRTQAGESLDTHRSGGLRRESVHTHRPATNYSCPTFDDHDKRFERGEALWPTTHTQMLSS